MGGGADLAKRDWQYVTTCTPSAIGGLRPVGRGADPRRILAGQQQRVSGSEGTTRRGATHQDNPRNGLCTPLEFYDVGLGKLVIERVRGRHVGEGGRGGAAFGHGACDLDAAKWKRR